MESTPFDHIARALSARQTRRSAIAAGLGLAAASVPLAARAAAQEATPAAEVRTFDPADPHPSADAPPKTDFLYVQAFAGGAWAPKAGEEGVYTLTLAGASAQTVYFSDRPERIFGLAPTAQFLENLGFTPVNPPNAALVAQTPDGQQEVLVVELFNPVFDTSAATLTYDAKALADYDGEGLAHAARQQADYELTATFAAGSLFIDGCPDGCATCYQMVNDQEVSIGGIDNVGRCGSGDCGACNDNWDSQYYGKLCHEAFPTRCSYTCNGTSCGWACFVKDFDNRCANTNTGTWTLVIGGLS